MKEQFIPAAQQAQTEAAEQEDAIHGTDGLDNPEAYPFDPDTYMQHANGIKVPKWLGGGGNANTTSGETVSVENILHQTNWGETYDIGGNPVHGDAYLQDGKEYTASELRVLGFDVKGDDTYKVQGRNIRPTS